MSSDNTKDHNPASQDPTGHNPAKQTQGAPSRADQRRNAQRAALLDAASEMLMRGGPDAISLRKLARKIGTSTMAVYTAFGGKDGLITALFDEAFDRLGDAQQAVPRNADPLLWMADLARAYRRFALDNPSYYALMISATMPVSEAMRHAEVAGTALPARGISGHPSYQYLYDAVTACIAEGRFPDTIEPIMIADALWAVVHGLCSLELAGFHDSATDADAHFAITTRAVIRGFLTDKDRAHLDAISATP